MKKLIPIIIISTLAIYFVFFSCLGSFTTYEDAFYGNRMQDAAEINARWHLDREPSILYLEPGDAPYFLHANSSCRFIAPLPLVRHRDNWNLTNLPQYWETYDCVKQYQGRFIVLERGDPAMDWFGENESVRQSLVKIIRQNYTVIYNKSWRVLEKS